MGLITKEVEIGLSPTNIKYYRSLGYEINKLQKYNWGSIVVKTQDLQSCSLARVIVKCDLCGKEYSTSYLNYNLRNIGGIWHCADCKSKAKCGENNPNWIKDKTQEERQSARLIDGYQDFIKTVLIRDDYTCQCCEKSVSGKMVAHHINGYNWFIEGRVDPNNGITLCENCHENFHSIYGKGNNTKEQFEEWLGKSMEIIKYNGELPRTRKVYCFEDKVIYNSVIEVSITENIKTLSQIYNVCNRKELTKEYRNKDGTIIQYTSPCLTVNGKHFIWYDEYLKMTDTEILNYIHQNPHFKKIICLTTGEIFESIKEAKEKYKCSSHIGDCCVGRRETCGQLPDGTKLKWMYYGDYIKNCDNNDNCNKFNSVIERRV